MPNKSLYLATLALLTISLILLTSCSSASKAPPPVGSARIDYTLGVPGGVIFQTFRASVTVSAIEPATRMATLQLPDGKKFTVRVSPDVTTFDQIRVGDRVTATVLQKIEASLTKQDGDGTTAAGDHAPNGNQTGDAAGKTMQMTARVIAIDSENHTTTLRFADGSTETLAVRNDVDLSRRKVGDEVLFRVTEMIALHLVKQ
jgi:hypothetical protein